MYRPKLILSLFAVFISLIYGTPANAQIDEYLLKAVWFEKFTRFIEWPNESNINDPTQPFIICVIGTNPFGNTLEKVYKNQKIKNKPVEIRYITKISQITDCHMLFITQSERYRIQEIIDALKDRPILMIADSEGVAELGVHINFYLVQSKVSFEVNETAARQSKLYMSFRLLNVARVVNPIKG